MSGDRPKSGRIDDPLYWVGVANRYGIKPWLGLFLDNMNTSSIASCRRYTNDAQATAFPHAFAGYDLSVGSEIQEEWIYFDHWRKQDHHDAVIRRNLARVENWHRDNGIPISKVALGHYYEIGSNALSSVIKWGCDTICIHMRPGESYKGLIDGEPWISSGPFRTFVGGRRNDPLPCYYADYLRIEGRPELSGKLFNCVTEIRDTSGYEWAPTNDVQRSIDHGIIHLRRAFDSMALGTLFTHESDYLQHITPENWEHILSAICSGVKTYDPMFLTLDQGCAYARARHDTTILGARVQADELHISIAGSAREPTKAFLFTEGQGEIVSTLIDIPAPAETRELVVTLKNA